jgi:hypothetical protein
VRRGQNIHHRLRVRRPGDVWSDDFRAELRRDRRFEASLIARQMIVLAIVLAIIALRLLLT